MKANGNVSDIFGLLTEFAGRFLAALRFILLAWSAMDDLRSTQGLVRGRHHKSEHHDHADQTFGRKSHRF